MPEHSDSRHARHHHHHREPADGDADGRNDVRAEAEPATLRSVSLGARERQQRETEMPVSWETDRQTDGFPLRWHRSTSTASLVRRLVWRCTRDISRVPRSTDYLLVRQCVRACVRAPNTTRCSRRRRRRHPPSRQATTSRRRRTLPSGKGYLSTPCRRYVPRRFISCLLFVRLSPSLLLLPSLPPFPLASLALSLSCSPALPLSRSSAISLLCPLLFRSIPSSRRPSPPISPPPRFPASFFIRSQETHSIIFHPDDFTRRLDRSMTLNDVIAVACARSPHDFSNTSPLAFGDRGSHFPIACPSASFSSPPNLSHWRYDAWTITSSSTASPACFPVSYDCLSLRVTMIARKSVTSYRNN